VLASLATTTHGHYRFVEDPAAVAGLFKDEVLAIQRTVAQDVRVAFAPGPGVVVQEVIGWGLAYNQATARYEVSLGSMSEGADLELLVRLAVGPHRDGATVELLDLGLSFVDVQTGTGTRSRNAFIAGEASGDAQARLASEDPELAREVAKIRTHAATLQVTNLARGGDLDGAKQTLRNAVAWAREEAKRLGDQELVEQADKLAALEKELKSLLPPPPPKGAGAGTAADMAFAPAPPSPAGARALREAHSEAYREIHD
jgi:Ca-activated chloride channel family protein